MALILLKCLHLLYVNGFDNQPFASFSLQMRPRVRLPSPFPEHSLPCKLLISLQLAPQGMRGPKIAGVILQHKCFAKAFSYFRSLSKNMSPCVKTCVVQVVQHSQQLSCAAESYCHRHPFRWLLEVSAALAQIQQSQITRFLLYP